MLIAEGKMSSWSIREQSEKKEGSGRGVDRMRLFWSPSGPELWLSMLTWQLILQGPSIKWTLI